MFEVVTCQEGKLDVRITQPIDGELRYEYIAEKPEGPYGHLWRLRELFTKYLEQNTRHILDRSEYNVVKVNLANYLNWLHKQKPEHLTSTWEVWAWKMRNVTMHTAWDQWLKCMQQCLMCPKASEFYNFHREQVLSFMLNWKDPKNVIISKPNNLQNAA